MSVPKAGFHLCTMKMCSHSAASLRNVSGVSAVTTVQGRQFNSAKDGSAMSLKSFVAKTGSVKAKSEVTTAQPRSKPVRVPPSTPASIKEEGKDGLTAPAKSAQKPCPVKATGVSKLHPKTEGLGFRSATTVSRRDGGAVAEKDSAKERPKYKNRENSEKILKRGTSIQDASESVKSVANYDTTKIKAVIMDPAKANSGRSRSGSKRIETQDDTMQMTRPPRETQSNASKVISSEQCAAISSSITSQPSFKLSSSSQTIQLCSEWWITCFQRSGQVFSDLTFPFANMQVWVLAYQRAYTQLIGGSVDEIVVSEVYLSLQQLAGVVSNRRYNWGGEKRIYLASPVNDLGGQNQKSRWKASSSGCFQDNVVQEAILIVLEPIFEARFSFRSHASRPGRNAHTALRAVRNSFAGCSWLIRGDADILHNEVYISRFVDSFLRAVSDSRVYFLIKDGLSTLSSLKTGGTEKTSDVSNWGACQKLVPLFCNILMDQVDHFIEEKISSLSKEKQAPSRSYTPLLLKCPTKTTGKMRRIEYVRHGTEFLIASNGSLQEATEISESLARFMKKQLWVDMNKAMKISHVSTGIDFLDHSISQKVVRPIIFLRKASSGRVVEKRACRVVLSIKASRKCCQRYLEKLGTPASVKQIEEILRVLNGWYSLAENRTKAIQFCWLFLCSSYARDHCQKHNVLMDASLDDVPYLQQSFRMMDQSSDSQKCHLVEEKQQWVPEHEKSLRDMAFFRREENLASATVALREMEKLSPQQTMSQIVWQFTRGSTSENGVIGQSLQVGSNGRELVESAA